MIEVVPKCKIHKVYAKKEWVMKKGALLMRWYCHKCDPHKPTKLKDLLPRYIKKSRLCSDCKRNRISWNNTTGRCIWCGSSRH